MLCGGWKTTEVNADHESVLEIVTPKINEILNANYTYTIIEVK